MTHGTTRVDRPDAAAINVARSRPVRGATVNSTPTTAQLIRRTDASIARPLYAGLGVALHHFTELLDDTIGRLDLHRSTTVLTKQVSGLMEDDEVLEAIRLLVTDPQRVAMPDGRRVAELCGTPWNDVRAVADRRSAASCDGAGEFGQDAIVNLAVVRGVGAVEPWWGTPMWRERVERIPAGSISPDERERLLERPELADDELVAMVLDDAPPSTAAPRRTRATNSTVATDHGQESVPEPSVSAADTRAVLTR